MEKKLKPKKEKKKSGLYRLLADKKKRYLVMFCMMLPFIAVIAIFGSIAYKEGKNLMELAKGNTGVETKAENIIESMDYVLRDNPTDIQKEYFAQLKEAIEGEERSDDVSIAALVAKNYVVDFYTWSNKRGQYDVGGMNFIYIGEFENGDHFKENVYQKARDGFYKYISVYGTQYGKENLLEVEEVEVIKSEKMSSQYHINEHVAYKQDEEGEWYDYREDFGYDAYAISCRWTYKENSYLPLSEYANSINLLVIDRNGRFEIIEASENTLKARTLSEEGSANETNEDAEENAGIYD